MSVSDDGKHARPAAPLLADAGGWAHLLEYLRDVRGFDFHGYKPRSLSRRIRKRMGTLGIETFGAYQAHLETHANEFAALFDVALINVTDFFRDPEAWTIIRATVVPDILAHKTRNQPVRVWSAGCASGEEAYTLAMVLAEATGLDDFRGRVKIYGTDIDEEALTTARHAVYTSRQVRGVPEDLLKKYFDREGDLFVVRRDLRRQVIFGRHDLMTDAPIARIDLLACRNVLMYFTAEIRARLLPRFHFALNNHGVLFLGRAETPTYGQAFLPVDDKHRISRKVAGRRLPEL